MTAPRKIAQLPVFLAFVCVCFAALLLAPAGAGASHSGPVAFSHKRAAAKHAAGKRCRRHAKKHRGCRTHSGHPRGGAPGAQGTPPRSGSAGDDNGSDSADMAGEDELEESASENESAEEEAEGAEEEAEEAETEEEAEAAEEGEPAEEEGEGGALTRAVSAPAGQLRWAPPTLVEPKTITLGTGYTHTTLATNRDYIIKLPPTKKIGGTWIDGGHNVVIIGGYLTVPQTSFAAATNEATALSIKGATGTVHVEGVLIDGSGGGEFDGVTINAPEATVQLENLRIVGVRGCNEKIHADVVQPWGGVKDLRIDRLTGKSKCQGLTIKPDLGKIGSAEIDEVDLTAVKEENVTRAGHMLWMTRGMTSCETYPMSLTNLYVSPLPGQALGTAVWPQKNSTSACPASGTKSLLGWPVLPFSGSVSLGPPASGSYVPSGVAGIGYQSPGYRAG